MQLHTPDTHQDGTNQGKMSSQAHTLSQEEGLLVKVVELLLETANDKCLVSVSTLQGHMSITEILHALKALERQGVIYSQKNYQRFIRRDAAQALLSSLAPASDGGKTRGSHSEDAL